MLQPVLIRTRLACIVDQGELCGQLSRLSRPAPGKFNSAQFRIVGMPAYLSQHAPEAYERAAMQDNEQLWWRFSGVYIEVFRGLEEFLGERIHTSLRAAIPGFHVIRNNGEMPRYGGGVPHIDASQRHVPMFASNNESGYSFTVLLSAAGDDIGLEYWPAGMSEELAKESPREGFFPYETFSIVMFSSDLVHRIGAFEGVRDRITLQGHVLRHEGRLIAFW